MLQYYGKLILIISIIFFITSCASGNDQQIEKISTTTQSIITTTSMTTTTQKINEEPKIIIEKTNPNNNLIEINNTYHTLVEEINDCGALYSIEADKYQTLTTDEESLDQLDVLSNIAQDCEIKIKKTIVYAKDNKQSLIDLNFEYYDNMAQFEINLEKFENLLVALAKEKREINQI